MMFIFFYRLLGGIVLFFSSKDAKLFISTGFKKASDLGGYFINVSFGRAGLFSNPPPHFGHTLCNISFTQSLQKVHSKVHIIASELLYGRFLPQFSHIGLSSSIIK
jgi:hypothetical protein